MLQPTLSTQQKAYISKLQSYGLNIVPFTKEKRPIQKQFYQSSYSIEELELALQQGFVLAAVNDGRHQMLDFDRGSACTVDSAAFKRTYIQLLEPLCKHFGVGLHESPNGFHLLGLPTYMFDGFNEHNIKITPRTKHQALILPYRRGLEHEVYVEYTGVTAQISLEAFVSYLYQHRYVDGYLLELALQDFCRTHQRDISHTFQMVFQSVYDDKRTKYIDQRYTDKPITFGSVIAHLPPLYAHILKQLLPAAPTRLQHVSGDEYSFGDILQELLALKKQLDRDSALIKVESLINSLADIMLRRDLVAMDISRLIQYNKTKIRRMLQRIDQEEHFDYLLSLTSSDFALLLQAQHRAALRALREHFSRLPKTTKTLKQLMESALNRSLNQVEYEMLYHFFANLKRGVVFGERILSGELDPKKYQPYKTCLNLYSPIQGIGKSTLVSSLARYLNSKKRGVELTYSGDLDKLFSDRHSNAASTQYILVILDEQAGFNRTNEELLKARIDADTITNRDLHSAHQTHYVNLSSFIGTSNKPLSQLLSDESGARRFFEIELFSAINREVLSEAFWDEVFASVDEAHFDTYTPLLQQWQEEHLRYKTPLQLFFEETAAYLRRSTATRPVVESELEQWYLKIADQYVRASELYKAFALFCDVYGYCRPSLQKFSKQIAKHPYISQRVRAGYVEYRINLSEINKHIEENL